MTTNGTRFWILGLLALASVSYAQEKPLKVGLDPRAAPWAFVPGEDYSAVDFRAEPSVSPTRLEKLVGLDVDVSRALADELKRTLVIVPVSYYSLEQALLAGRIDLIVNAWTPSRETPAAIRTSEPYYHWGLLIAARAGDPSLRALTDLKGARVGHFESQIVNRTLHSLGARELETYDNEEKLFGDLKDGTLDAVVYDSPSVRWRANHDDALVAVGEPLNKLGYHVAVRERDSALFVEVQTAIARLTRSGALEAIQRKWEEPGP